MLDHKLYPEHKMRCTHSTDKRILVRDLNEYINRDGRSEAHPRNLGTLPMKPFSVQWIRCSVHWWCTGWIGPGLLKRKVSGEWSWYVGYVSTFSYNSLLVLYSFLGSAAVESDDAVRLGLLERWLLSASSKIMRCAWWGDNAVILCVGSN